MGRAELSELFLIDDLCLRKGLLSAYIKYILLAVMKRMYNLNIEALLLIF